MPRNPTKNELAAHDCITRAHYWLQEARAFLEQDSRSESMIEDIFELQIELSRISGQATWRQTSIHEP